MEKYFALVYDGPPFVLFGTPHLIALGIITLGCFSYLYFRNIWGEKEKKIVRWVFAIAIVINESSLHIWSAYWGIWNIQTMLPLHMCSVMVWITTYTAFTSNRSLYDFTYFLGIGGALQAVLTPADVAMYDLPHYRSFQSLFAHGLLITIPLFMTVVEGYRPTLESFKRIFIWANIYMVFIFFLNRAIGSNYLFIAEKPPSPTLMDALSPWPWYIPQLEVLAFAILFMLYIPFLIMDRRAKKAEVRAA